MANPAHHAISSARRYGGEPEQYRPIHEWFDEPKEWFADFRQRAIRHHSEGIGIACGLFADIVVDIGDGRTRIVPVRWIAEQHVREDLDRIPTAADWLRWHDPAGVDDPQRPAALTRTRDRVRYRLTVSGPGSDVRAAGRSSPPFWRPSGARGAGTARHPDDQPPHQEVPVPVHEPSRHRRSA
jgi:hypothetical protein